MDFATSLQLTPKGADEIRSRTHKLGLKKRSVLLLLDRPRPIQYLVGRSVLPQGEMLEEIRTLIGDQFVAVSAGGGANGAEPGQPGSASGVDGSFHLYGGIIVSEAKFLLTDFCVDHFGTQSQAFADEIGACSKENDLRLCLGKIVAAAQKRCPERIPDLLRLVKEINETA